MPMDLEPLRACLRDFLENPDAEEEFDMERWGGTDCGSAMCIGGWIQRRFGLKAVDEYAMQGLYMATGSVWPEHIRRESRLRGWPAPGITKEIAAEAVRKFITRVEEANAEEARLGLG